MKHYKLLTLLLTSLLTVSFTSGDEIDLEKPSSKLRRFISDVIFVAEAGDRERLSKRLPESIVVQFHGQPEPRAVAERHLVEMCQITGIKRVESASPAQPIAKIDIYFGTEAELVPVARKIDRQINLDQGSTYWAWWDDKNIIDRAVIFVATDKLSGAALEDKLIERLFGVFGIPARSKEFDESCLSSNEQVLNRLQPLDKAMLKFYYRAVPAGTKPRDIDKIFREHWSEKH